MTKIITQQVPANTWKKVYTFSAAKSPSKGLVVQNTGTAQLQIQSSAAKPTTATEGKLLTPISGHYAEALIPKITSSIWVRMKSGTGSTGAVAIQEFDVE